MTFSPGRLALAERAVDQLRGSDRRSANGGRASPTHRDEIERTDYESAPEPFPTVRLLEGDPPPPPRMGVENLVVHADINLDAGHGGSAKSVIGINTGICTVLGRPVFGSLKVQIPGPYVLLVPEDGQAVARMMTDALVEGYSLSPNDRATLREQLLIIPDDVSVVLTTDTRRLGITMRDAEAVGMLADPLTNLIGGASEREEEVARLVCASLRRNVCQFADASVKLNHHNRKPGKDSGPDTAATVHDARGSGGWVNSARLVFGISKKLNRITMTALKANRIRADIRHELDLEIEADPKNPARWLSCRITDANAGASSETLTAGIGRSLNANEQAALVCLDDTHEPGKRLSWSRWLSESGLKPETFRSVRDRLITADIVATAPTGRKARNGGPEHSYSITPSGKNALNSGWTHAR